MVYVYAKQSELNKYIGKDLSVEEIKDTLMDLGMDVKGESTDADPELKIEITAEKIDMVSTVGIARAIKYYRGLATGFPSYILEPTQEKVLVKKSASLAYPPKTACAIVRGVDMNEEFLQEMIDLQEKLTTSFGRNRKKAGIGIYPIDNIQFPITYTGEKPTDIKFRPLGHEDTMTGAEVLEKHDTGKKFAHLLEGKEYFAVFRDSTGAVLAMPPIINSHETAKVAAHHKDLFIEVSGRNLHMLDLILKVLVTTFIEMGAKAEAVLVEYEGEETYELNLDPHEESLSLGFVNKLIGISIKENVAKELLTKMMYGVKSAKYGELIVDVPAFRGDVWHDVDIADDIARAYGYNNIEPRYPGIATVGTHLPYSLFRERFTDAMVNLGFLELYTYILTSSQEQFDMMGKDASSASYVRLEDSADEGINMCRVSILPELLKSLRINRKNKYPQKVFENGFTLQIDEAVDTGAANEARLAVALADPKANYTQIKAVLDALAKLQSLDFSFKEFVSQEYIEGRSAEIFLGEEVVGSIGEIHPQVLDNYSLLVPVVAFELNLEKIWQVENPK